MHTHPLPIVRRTWSRTHIAHSEVTVPFPLRLHSEQIKRHWLSQLPFWRVSLQRWILAQKVGPRKMAQVLPFEAAAHLGAQAVLATPSRLVPHALPTVTLNL